MSSLAAARADNFYYPPDFDPQKHQTLNKYNGQHPLRERAAKLDQGILVIRFEIPFNIWCEKCGEHIAKGERFNAEKKAIGQYHSTKILQFTMAHHCGCKITIQTDPKRAEYLVVEGARKKEESYSAADAEVIELPDDVERERRQQDPLYRLEYQQGAKAKALTAMERLAAIQDVVDVRATDPYGLNRVLRAALRGEKRAAAVLDNRRAELGLPESVPLLAQSEGDTLAAEVAFLTSSARATATTDSRRKRILEQDIFCTAICPAMEGLNGIGNGGAVGGGAAATAVGSRGGSSLGPWVGEPPGLKRQAVGAAGPARMIVLSASEQQEEQHLQKRQQQKQQGSSQQFASTSSQVVVKPADLTHNDASRSAPHCSVSNVTVANVNPNAGGGSCNVAPSRDNNSGSSSRPVPGAAALAAAAAAAAARASALTQAHSAAAKATGCRNNGGGSSGSNLAVRRSGPTAVVAAASAPKRSLTVKAAELQKRRQGFGGRSPWD